MAIVGDYAVVRGGDKGDNCHFAIAAESREASDLLWERLTGPDVAAYLCGDPQRTVERYRLDNIDGIVLVVHDVLDGGAGSGWALHAQFVLADKLMDMPIGDVPA